MKEFEKWLNENKCPRWKHREVCIARDAWRAGLEMVLVHKKPVKYKDYKFDYIKTDVIEEELNATSKKRC